VKTRCKVGEKLEHKYNRELHQLENGVFVTPGMRYFAERAKRAFYEHKAR